MYVYPDLLAAPMGVPQQRVELAAGGHRVGDASDDGVASDDDAPRARPRRASGVDEDAFEVRHVDEAREHSETPVGLPPIVLGAA